MQKKAHLYEISARFLTESAPAPRRRGQVIGHASTRQLAASAPRCTEQAVFGTSDALARRCAAIWLSFERKSWIADLRAKFWQLDVPRY